MPTHLTDGNPFAGGNAFQGTPFLTRLLPHSQSGRTPGGETSPAGLPDWLILGRKHAEQYLTETCEIYNVTEKPGKWGQSVTTTSLLATYPCRLQTERPKVQARGGRTKSSTDLWLRLPVAALVHINEKTRVRVLTETGVRDLVVNGLSRQTSEQFLLLAYCTATHGET